MRWDPVWPCTAGRFWSKPKPQTSCPSGCASYEVRWVSICLHEANFKCITRLKTRKCDWICRCCRQWRIFLWTSAESCYRKALWSGINPPQSVIMPSAFCMNNKVFLSGKLRGCFTAAGHSVSCWTRARRIRRNIACLLWRLRAVYARGHRNHSRAERQRCETTRLGLLIWPVFSDCV